MITARFHIADQQIQWIIIQELKWIS